MKAELTAAQGDALGEKLHGHNRYRWGVLAICWLGFTLTSVDRSAWGPSALFIGQDLGVPLASLGVFATAYYAGYVFSNVAGGYFSDKIGGRALIAISLIGAGIFMVLFGSTKSSGVGIAVQGAIGLFAGAEYGAGVKLLASWFRPRELGKVMGIYTSATALGVLIANTIVPRLINAFDWTTSYHTFGSISIVTGIICYFLLRPGPVRIEVAQSGGSRSKLRVLAGNRNLMLLALSGFGGFWGTYGFVIWSNTLMVKERGIDHTVAGLIVGIFAAMGIFGKPAIGWFSDWLDGARRVPAIVMLLMFTAMLIVFGLLQSPLEFIIAAPFLGLAAYCYLPMIVALVPRLVGSAMLGTAAGMVNALWQLGSTLVPLAIGGAFAASGNSFIAAFAALAVGPFIGAIAMYFVNERPEGSRTEIDETAELAKT
ncbi:MFS transporter [Xanthobacter oligotrophicus]|uniref:MFS transporter n=1 Tax=Xanthobacter oligotrophicus TaxID=2607286 RepID=A0ABW7A2Y8_9HYPH